MRNFAEKSKDNTFQLSGLYIKSLLLSLDTDKDIAYTKLIHGSLTEVNILTEVLDKIRDKIFIYRSPGAFLVFFVDGNNCCASFGE